MTNWDEDSSRLRENLAHVLEQIVTAAEQRKTPTLEAARQWQRSVMRGLEVPNMQFVGAFRGEPGLENVQVRVGASYGPDSANVAGELIRFEAKLQAIVRELDILLPRSQVPQAEQIAAVIEVCAWVHAEWVRIHPFANGNGRTARLWANSLAIRYGLPAFIRLRPRPNFGYEAAGSKAMQGDWRPTVAVFHRLLNEFLEEI